MKKIAIFFALFTTLCYGSECPQLYPNEQPIEIQQTVELCNTFFVIRYDNTNKRTILVSERLRPGPHVSAPRNDAFHADTRVGNYPTPHQYQNTGFDKGHMAPAADASSITEMVETFVMTNMTPQEPTLNRESWRMLEESVRQKLSSAHSNVYILNIAVYGNIRRMNDIPVPTGYWKIVYIDGKTEYYYADNVQNGIVSRKTPQSLGNMLPN